MGMTIDEHMAQLKKLKSFHNGSYGASINFAIDIMRKYQQLQAEYENRLKADIVAMLTDIQLEIEEFNNPLDYDFEGYNQCAVDCEKLIQQKIDAIKEQTDRNDSK